MRWILLVLCSALSAQDFDVVIAGARVIDPQTRLDAVRSVGIRGSRIAAVSESALKGKVTIDAKGMVLAPGFIDLHSHGQDDENYRYKALDGVTTALEMEVGVWPVKAWYASREGKSLVNFGATAGHIPARMAAMKDTGVFLPKDAAAHKRATAEENRAILSSLRQGLNEGALGIGMGIAYVPAATRPEILDVFRVAAERKRPIYVHMRSPGAVEPGSVVESLQEVISDALITGASLHVVHITSMALGQTGLALEMIEGAKKRGLDITTECYPYTAGQTAIDSAVFDEGWQQKLRITYKDLQWVDTGERLTAESYARFRKTGGMVILHAIPEEAARQAIAHPMVMIASDGMLDKGKGHPRGAGTYARVLGHYSRDLKIVQLPEAIRKMTLAPAERAGLASKGRVKVGADADLVVFDPAKVIDRATFENPSRFSEGITHVLVNGVPVVRDGKIVEGVKPGRGVRTQE